MSSTLARGQDMESPQIANPFGTFTLRYLPWILSAGGLALYLGTLNHWVSISSLYYSANVAGCAARPNLAEPLYWVLTFPFRWLPKAMIPVALNAFAACCGALTLGLLARSVALLPHDRTQEQRDREPSEFSLLSIRSAWLPPVLAALVCGLQLTFWENATAASNEILNVLLFAYVIRCLLEFRLDERVSWLLRASFVYGLGMTNDWTFLAFLPAFLGALVWIRGLRFFETRFLTRMFLCGLAGITLYLLLPLAQSLQHEPAITFWRALKFNLGSQTAAVLRTFQLQQHELLLVGLTSLLPVVIVGIRWPSSFGDSNPLGIALATFTFHVVHALIFVMCIWVALDPPFSPRNIDRWGYPSLPAYYLGALAVGYFTGYFLLVFGQRSAVKSPRSGAYPRNVNWVRPFERVVPLGVWLLAVLATLAMLRCNLPQIRLTNGPMLRQYALRLGQGLPDRSPVILSDDSLRLWLMQLLQHKTSEPQQALFLDTYLLGSPFYQGYLKQTYPRQWTFDLPKDREHRLADTDLIREVYTLAQSNEVCYLHPSFGYYFEYFYAEPHGLDYKLTPYPLNVFEPPPLASALVESNRAFWKTVANESLESLALAVSPSNPNNTTNLVDRWFAKAHLKRGPNQDAATVAAWYGRSLDAWGVELQKLSQLAEAGQQFESTLQINPENRAAKINLEQNHRLQAGSEGAPQLSDDEIFGPKRDWNEAQTLYGPYDEPNCCYRLGSAFMDNGYYRQAAAEFKRTLAMSPYNLDATLRLGQLYVDNQMPDQALKLVERVKAKPENFKLGSPNEMLLLVVESSAYLAQSNLEAAQAAVQQEIKKYPGDERILAAATSVYLRSGHYSNALTSIEQQLQLAPDDATAQYLKGITCSRLGIYDQAIVAFTKVLELQTNNYDALRHRAAANLDSRNYEAAKRDFLTLQKADPTSYRVHYGLAEAAYYQHDTNTAIQEYELFLNAAPTNIPEGRALRARLKHLKSPAH